MISTETIEVVFGSTGSFGPWRCILEWDHLADELEVSQVAGDDRGAKFTRAGSKQDVIPKAPLRQTFFVAAKGAKPTVDVGSTFPGREAGRMQASPTSKGLHEPARYVALFGRSTGAH